MPSTLRLYVIAAVLAAPVRGAVVLNEVLIDPPGATESAKQYVELLGPPGMHLDGYAVAVVTGGVQRLYSQGSLVISPNRIEALLGLDGVQLGANGLLVLGTGTASDYPTLSADTAFRQWSALWSGNFEASQPLATAGSKTVLLLRQRPGAMTGGGPIGSPPADLRWGKGIIADAEKTGPIESPPGSGILFDQWGDGSLDEGGPNPGLGGNTLDLRGSTTPYDVGDDLEVVDELSYADGAGWQYDLDGRLSDSGSTDPARPGRQVHSLADPQGFNPHALARVDYRTRGSGWTPAPGATGQIDGRNWQDTATEQWIRGEVVTGSGGIGDAPQYFFSNAANAAPNALQPYMTNVPLWLNDATGTEFDFAMAYGFQVMAGRLNPLAVTFIPGDVDRDGACGGTDIAAVASVFGNSNWVFSNSFADAPDGNSGDPATQVRPWNVDLTGDGMIDPSDLQWVLNFQGDTTGRVYGARYDGTTPSTTGVRLNSNAGISCTVTSTVTVPSGHSTGDLKVGDLVQITIAARVTSGAIFALGQQNGIMQYSIDVLFSEDGVFRVMEEQSISPFASTRAIQSLLGDEGSLGIEALNGYTTAFARGLLTGTSLNRVTIQALRTGSADVTISPSSQSIFATNTPYGLKVGHTDHNGNPASAVYPVAIRLTVTSSVRPDFNGDGDVDEADLDHLVACQTGPELPQDSSPCIDARLDADNDVDQDDFGILQRCYTGENHGPAVQGCDAVP